MNKKWLVILMLLIPLGADSSGSALPALVISSDDPDFQDVKLGLLSVYKGEFREFNLEGNEKTMRRVGEELKASPPPVTIAVGDMALQMTKWFLPGRPVIYCSAPRASEFAPPPETTIGVSHFAKVPDQLAAIPELFPGRKRVGLFYGNDLAGTIGADGLKSEAEKLGLDLRLHPAESIQQVPELLKSELPELDLVWVFTDPVVFSKYSVEFVVIQAMAARVPIFCGDAVLARSGATAALTPDLYDVGRKLAREAEKVVGAQSPSFGEVLFADGSLVLNARVAEIFQVTMPPEILSRAKTIIR
jgi:putative ABC transport system substrate-binding protein